MAADRSGGEPVTPATTADSSSRVRLNISLYAATVLLACVAVFLSFVMQSQDVDVAFWKKDDGAATSQGLHDDVGRGVVTEIGAAPEDVQGRVADQLAAATAMAGAMTNLDYRDPDKAIAAVQALASGDFLKQYNSATGDLRKLATQARSTMTGTVVWTGLVAGDKDSATVIVATTGTVANKETDFKERENNYRIQIELVLDKGKWLTRDLQFVT